MEKKIFSQYHQATKRNYLERMKLEKPHEMEIASKFSSDYWDGDRRFGYGGYHYDGRFKPIAKDLIKEYQLNSKSKILDLGCGKAFLLCELKKLIPELTVVGIDISEYAINDSQKEVQNYLKKGDLNNPDFFKQFEDQIFDLTLSVMALHNLGIENLSNALKNISRISKESYITIESYRNWQELFNLQCWALTCKSFYGPVDWEYLFKKNHYNGDYEFLYFT